VKLFYRRIGKGKPLIILHGLFGMSDNWFSIAKIFSATHNVIIPDLRNHGNSPHSVLFTFKDMCSDLKELYDELNINQAIILGHSLGGKLAMYTALHFPFLVEKLIIADISPNKSFSEHTGIINAMMSVDFSKINNRNEVDQQLAASIQSLKIRQLIMKNLYWLSKQKLAWKINLAAILNNMEEVLKEISHKNSFTKDVLFLKGEYSDYITEKDLMRIQQLFPEVKMITIENAGHWLHADNPIAFTNAVRNFITNQRQTV